MDESKNIFICDGCGKTKNIMELSKVIKTPSLSGVVICTECTAEVTECFTPKPNMLTEKYIKDELFDKFIEEYYG